MALRNLRHEWHTPLRAPNFLNNQTPSTLSTDGAQDTPILEQEMHPTRSAPLSPLHRSSTPQIRGWFPSSPVWLAPVSLHSQDTLQSSSPKPPPTHANRSVLRSYSFYGPVPATPSRRPATPDDDDLEMDNPSQIPGYSVIPPSGVFAHDPSGPAPRTPLWTPAPDPDGFSLDGSAFILNGGGGYGADAYPSPPRTPQRDTYR